jgi:hypothetical protein
MKAINSFLADTFVIPLLLFVAWCLNAAGAMFVYSTKYLLEFINALSGGSFNKDE